MYLGNNIKYLRSLKNMSHGELAECLDKKDKGMIYRYEKSTTLPPLDVVLKMCEIFKVDLNSMVLRDIEKEGLPNKGVSEGEQRCIEERDALMAMLVEMRKRNKEMEARLLKE